MNKPLHLALSVSHSLFFLFASSNGVIECRITETSLYFVIGIFRSDQDERRKFTFCSYPYLQYFTTSPSPVAFPLSLSPPSLSLLTTSSFYSRKFFCRQLQTKREMRLRSSITTCTACTEDWPPEKRREIRREIRDQRSPGEDTSQRSPTPSC